MPERNWIDLKQDPVSGIESMRAHFEGHAYDPQWLDRELRAQFDEAPDNAQLSFAAPWPTTAAWQSPPPTPSSPCTARNCGSCARPRWTTCCRASPAICAGAR